MADHAHNLRATFTAQGFHSKGPIGVITRGTTNINRLRRCDRWMTYESNIQRSLMHSKSPLAIDVGYGASHTTTCEWATWLRRSRPDIEVIGLEIDPNRVLPPRNGVRFELGGFELAGYTPTLVRAFNVLRQYDASQVTDAWQTVCSRLAPNGFFVEGTCDELGRRCSWVLLDATGPQSLTLAWDPRHTERPSELAERLPKALIHRNIAGENIYDLLQQADAAWDRAAGWAPYGPRIRWREARQLLINDGVPLNPVRRRIRDNLLTVPWQYVA
ncbi:methylase [Corynebacterium freiburgense]|uniref:methylase n=1 Tax=Corynebacterium freiburgense TaxID=556548 RepID=UPI0003FDB35D|nr:methylase [Corynebacterium freiburgense]WJZ01532.1 hypothetical protein CFREI_01120 [Corynebacterium freiburgense]